jgi:2-polyprenyl-3-methyl-5-hydroxy-6-metoxy-1,4-benzoquinol methylase
MNMDVIAPFIEYYEKHKISPVTKAIHEKKAFFMQREFLYSTLGVSPCLLKDKAIIEFGPGNGVNAIYTYSLKPKKYVLVEGNPIAIQNIKENFQLYYTSLDQMQVDHCLIEEFNHQPKFDLVICENVIPYQDNPANFVNTLSQNAVGGGLLFITCNDPVSMLSETLRSIIGLIITKDISDYDKKTDFLTIFFTTHLKNLTCLGRDLKSWIQDNVLNVRWVMDVDLFSICEAIDALSETCRFYASSPSFSTDIRWYKSVKNSSSLNHRNEIAKESYYKNMINLLDFRFEFPPHSVELGKQILEAAANIRSLCKEYYISSAPQTLKILIESLQNLSLIVSQISKETAKSIDAYADVLISNKYEVITEIDDIINWWGRGTQHVSFIKNF